MTLEQAKLLLELDAMGLGDVQYSFDEVRLWASAVGLPLHEHRIAFEHLSPGIWLSCGAKCVTVWVFRSEFDRWVRFNEVIKYAKRRVPCKATTPTCKPS